MLLKHEEAKPLDVVTHTPTKAENSHSIMAAPLSLAPEAMIEALPFGLICFDIGHTTASIKSANRHARELFGIRNNELPCLLTAAWDDPAASKLQDKILRVHEIRSPITHEWSKRSGTMEHFLASQIQPIVDSKNGSRYVMCTIEDQTAEKLAEQNIMHHALHDTLTGQPNRVLFRNRLEEAVADSERDTNTSGVAVLVINVDRFQQINESFGHSAGDRFLISMASTLRRCIDSSHVLARLSGDEFAVLIPKLHNPNVVDQVTGRIHAAMQQPYDLDGHEVFTSVSIGVATSISSNTHPEDLIRDADFAMHRAKVAGKARTETYLRSKHQRARSQFHLETELRRAVEREELSLVYQPIIDIRTSRLKGFEALTRWEHRTLGPVSPVEFISLAEETGIIVPLGRWALDAACKLLRNWVDKNGEGAAVPVNVNVSGVQFARDDVADVVERTLKKYELPGNLLRVELTESSIMGNPQHISDSLQRIRALGVKVALDDFGTGYSSLNYLHQFPIDIIKIDRSFINQLKRGNAQCMILEMIAMLAHNLGHTVVAEGLEGTDHIDMVAEMGFQYAQGYFYSKPVSEAEASEMTAGAQPWPTHEPPAAVVTPKS